MLILVHMTECWPHCCWFRVDRLISKYISPVRFRATFALQKLQGPNDLFSLVYDRSVQSDDNRLYCGKNSLVGQLSDTP